MGESNYTAIANWYMYPTQPVQGFTHRTVPSACASPAHMGDGDPLAGAYLHPVLVPLARHLLVRHFTLEHSLFCSLHRQVRNVLQDLQLLLWMKRKKGGNMDTPIRPQRLVSTHYVLNAALEIKW